MKNTKRTVIEVQSDARTGFYDATEAIAAWASGQKGSLLHLFLPHTTAALVISDKMDTVSRDVDMLLGTIFRKRDLTCIARRIPMPMQNLWSAAVS